MFGWAVNRTDEGKIHPLFVALWIAASVTLFLYRVEIFAWAEQTVLAILSEHISTDALINKMDPNAGLLETLLVSLAGIVVAGLALIVYLIVGAVLLTFRIPLLQFVPGWGVAYVLTFIARKTIWPISVDTYLGFNSGRRRRPAPRAVTASRGRVPVMSESDRHLSRVPFPEPIYFPTPEEIRAAGPIQALLMNEALKRQKKLLESISGTVTVIRHGLQERLEAEKALYELNHLQETFELQGEQQAAERERLRREAASANRAQEREQLEHEIAMAELRDKLEGRKAPKKSSGPESLEDRLRGAFRKKAERIEALENIRAEVQKEPPGPRRAAYERVLRDLEEELKREGL